MTKGGKFGLENLHGDSIEDEFIVYCAWDVAPLHRQGVFLVQLNYLINYFESLIKLIIALPSLNNCSSGGMNFDTD